MPPKRKSEESNESEAYKVPDDGDAVSSHKKRKSRFDDDVSASTAANVAAIKAAEISQSLLHVHSSATLPDAAALPLEVTDIQAQIAAQVMIYPYVGVNASLNVNPSPHTHDTCIHKIASVTSLLQHANKEKHEQDRKSAYRTLRLDSMGREIDDKGNLIKSSGPVFSLAANVQEGKEMKKKENPYLMHKTAIKPEAPVEEDSAEIVDSRLKLASRSVRAKKAFNFVEAGIFFRNLDILSITNWYVTGTYVKQEDAIRSKEERKMIAGYSSGRKAPEVLHIQIEHSRDSTELMESRCPS